MSRRARRRAPEITLEGAFGDLRADFDAAHESRFERRLTGVSVSGSGADYHLRAESQFLRLIERARYYDRNNMVVGQGVNRLVDNVVQDGITLDPQTGDTDLDTDLAARWKAWAEAPDECDAAGELNWHGLEKITLRQVLVDGDALLLPKREGQIEGVEAHRLRTPRKTTRNVVHGVLLDPQTRRRQEYWLTRQDVDPHKSVSHVRDIKPYPARDDDGQRQVFHVYNPQRYSQTRGVTVLAPVSAPIGMHDDLQFVNLVRAKVAACYTIFHQREADFAAGPAKQRGEQTQETLPDGSSRTIEGIAPGMEIFGDPGEQLIGFSPNIPNPEFFQHAMLILTFIAINLDLPLAVLLLDPTKTNFSGWRGAIDQARIGFRRVQRWLVARMHRPVYHWKVQQWLADDPALRVVAKQSRIDLFGHRWNPPRWPYIEPLKDATADLLRLRNVLTSPRRLHAEGGRDWNEIATETVEDNAFAINLAKDAAAVINKKYPADRPVDWRELLSLPMPQGMQIKIAADGGGEQNEKEKR